jgi:hypothetical protein
MEPKNPPYDLAAFIKLRADTHEVDLNRVKLVSVFTVFGSEMLLLYPSISLLNNFEQYFFQFFILVIEKEYYYTVYCFNMVDC